MSVAKKILHSGLLLLMVSCKTSGHINSNSETKDAVDVAGAFLPTTVAYQWTCVESTRTDAEKTPLPSKPSDFPSGKHEVYLALQGDTFYFDRDGKFLAHPDTEVPETWQPDGMFSGPGFRRYKIRLSLKQDLEIQRHDPKAIVPSFEAIVFSGLLSSGYYAGSFFAREAGQTDRKLYDCFQKKWWPLAPEGW